MVSSNVSWQLFDVPRATLSGIVSPRKMASGVWSVPTWLTACRNLVRLYMVLAGAIREGYLLDVSILGRECDRIQSEELTAALVRSNFTSVSKTLFITEVFGF